jgi:glycosyltransferase involved in cell wall biosynthesis
MPDHPRRHAVGYVLKMYPRFSETFILNEILALEELGTPVHVFSLRPPADGRFHEALAQVQAPVSYLEHRLRGPALWEVLRRGRRDLPGLATHLDAVLEVGPDEAAAAVEVALEVRRAGLTHLHAHFGSVATTVARLAARLAGVDYSFTAHAKDIFHESVDPADLRAKLADARTTITVSDFNVRYLAEHHADPRTTSRLVRVYNGLDLRRFAFHPYVDRPATVCAVGRLVEKKGFAVLLDAIARLLPHRPDVRVDLVGSGPEQERLEDQAARLGLTDVVRFHGSVPQEQVHDLVARSGVFAAPCLVGADGNRDGLPTVLTEALAAGTPCVATPVTGIPEVIRDGETGLLVPESDPAALAAALRRVLDSPDLAADLARAGRRLVEQEFDIQRNVTVLDAVFRGGGDRPVHPQHARREVTV